MTQKHYNSSAVHTNAWIAQTWIAFVVSIGATTLGLLALRANFWEKGYLGMGMLFSIGSTVSLSKTIRDVEESKRLINRVDEAKLEKLLASHNIFQ
jgi:hypothetical protein